MTTIKIKFTFTPIYHIIVVTELITLSGYLAPRFVITRLLPSQVGLIIVPYVAGGEHWGTLYNTLQTKMHTDIALVARQQ